MPSDTFGKTLNTHVDAAVTRARPALAAEGIGVLLRVVLIS
jgi:hypothetical protein